jgi:hypothetical protein
MKWRGSLSGKEMLNLNECSKHIILLDANLFIVQLGGWKTNSPAAWKGGEVKICDGLQV